MDKIKEFTKLDEIKAFSEMQRELENIYKKYSPNENKNVRIRYKTFFSIISSK